MVNMAHLDGSDDVDGDRLRLNVRLEAEQLTASEEQVSPQLEGKA